jgi:hypothetical protein
MHIAFDFVLRTLVHLVSPYRFSRYVDFSKTHFGIPSGLTVYPRASSLEFQFSENKNFFGACLLKSAHFGGNSSTRPDDVERRLKFE